MEQPTSMQDAVQISPARWQKAMEKIRDSIGDEAFDAWITPTTLDDYRAGERRLILAVPNEFYRRWIEKRYLAQIEQAFCDALGTDVAAELVVDEGVSLAGEPSAGDLFAESTETLDEDVEVELPRERVQRANGTDHSSSDYSRLSRPRITPERSKTERRPAPTRVPPVEETTPNLPRLNNRYLFDDFVVGESNRFAYSAAVAVADPKGKAFNPLFIYGGTGLGKTHLMQAIGHRVLETDPRLRVIYVTSEQFINNFIDAIQNKRLVEFRNSFRNVDLLLIDDVQFLTGKERTQQEFFHTFNALYDAGKKVVVTSDRPPRDLQALEDRLRSRFEWGLLVDIQPPDLETRIAILRKKAEQEGVRLPSDVILFIAERITENIREMEGALKRLRMASSLHNRAIDLETARNVLGHLFVGSPEPRVTVEDVQRAVCNYFDIRPNELLGKNRSKKFAQPRHLAQYLCRKLTELSFPDIAQKFGGKDHTSIIYACRKVENSLQKDPNMANVVHYLTKQITKGADL